MEVVLNNQPTSGTMEAVTEHLKSSDPVLEQERRGNKDVTIAR